MKTINLRELYPDMYKTDTYVEVTEEVLEAIQAAQRMEATYERRLYRHKAHYSLDYGNGIEKATMTHAPTPEDIFEAKQQQEQLYAAVMSLPEKQAKRIYARFYLGMTPTEIADAEKVDVSCVRRSIRNGLKRLAKKLR
ncbi:MAG: sigma-70 family RNA polymerase sigma factor [Clostridiales bacterium]|nr:sigma-70 family RNA polymerase sigma factor [Clostridiales bacterium]